MAAQIIKYQSKDGTEFDTSAEADAHDLMVTRGEEISNFVASNFPSKPDAKRRNPHAATAIRAIALWLGSQGSVQVTA